jgi:exonuclease III
MERNLVKLATYNINNINKRLDNLLAWLAKAEPDVVSLQELKAEQEAFPVDALRTLGYEAVWQGERSWNGVAILARHHVVSTKERMFECLVSLTGYVQNLSELRFAV